jgi:hypothetical protein
MPESAVERMERVNEIGLVQFIDWLLKTPIKGESISNAVWTALARHVRTVLFRNKMDAYTKYCTSYSWSVNATGPVEDPDINIIFVCRPVDSSLAFSHRFDGRFVISKKHYNNDISKDAIIAIDNEDNPRYVITAEIIL